MTQPLIVDLPHTLGRVEARRRIEGGMGKLTAYMPSGAQTRHNWSGDRLDLNVQIMGQSIDVRIQVEETLARVELVLPPALSFFTRPIEAALRRGGSELLEDKTVRR